MDADVYGPSIPHLLGLTGRPEIVDGKIQPIDADGMPVMSMGFVLEKDQAVIWRGPMLHGSITQFLRDTHWGELDYLIIDLPPGTGDVVLTLSQLLRWQVPSLSARRKKSRCWTQPKPSPCSKRRRHRFWVLSRT